MPAVAQQAPAVPGITQQALDAIGDENIRTVLQQLITGWQVRNGASGDGSNAFVTRGELGMNDGGGIGAVGFSGGSQIAATAFLQPGVVTALINAIEASIMASAFFQSLGSSFNSPAGITKKQTILSNAVGQLSDEVTTLGSSVGNLSAGLQQEATTRANADGELGAQWTVKTDVNGYVAGFGLATTANNSTPFSSFIVRADDFAIGSPSGPGISPQVPFVVYTTPQTIGGQTVAPGVYMTRAFIANGIIDSAAIALAAITQANIAAAAIGSAQIQNAAVQNAHIGYAAVDTLRLAGQCVTVQASYSIRSGDPTTNVTYVSSGGNLIIFTQTFGWTTGSSGTLYMDGSAICGGNQFALAAPAAGAHTFSVSNESGSGSGLTVLIFEAKR